MLEPDDSRLAVDLAHRGEVTAQTGTQAKVCWAKK